MGHRSAKRVACLAGLVAGAFVCGPALADPIIAAQTIHYNLTGKTLRDLIVQMKTMGPEEGDSAKHWGGMTRWQISWSYTYQKTATACALVRVAVRLSLVYTMPVWIAEAQADPVAQRKWDAFLDALRVHEGGHGQYAVAAANEIESAITALPSQSNCQVLGATANALGERLLAKCKATNVEYDRVTQNGRTQGAYLVP